MRQYIKTLTLILYISTSALSLYGWNNQHWLGNCDRVIAWSNDETADYLRLGVLRDGVYRVSAADIATAFGISTNEAVLSVESGDLALTRGTNSVAWTSDNANLLFYGEATDQLYAPENVYFLRRAPGARMLSQSVAADPHSGTNTWFMQSRSYRSDFLDVTAYYDRRSTNASITNAPVFGMSLGSGYCNRIACEFTADLPGYLNTAMTNINLTVQAISYGDYGQANDTHLLETLVNNVSCGTYSWTGERLVSFKCSTQLAAITNGSAQVRIANLTPAEYFLLLDVEIEYPRVYQVDDEPLLCSGGDQSNIAVSGKGSNTAARIWDVTDSLHPVTLDAAAIATSNGWSAVFSCNDANHRYAVFEAQSCFEPSLTGFKDIEWSTAGAIPTLVIVTPPRRWVSGFESALEPLVKLRRAQGIAVRVVDAEDIYNAFSDGLVNPHAFQSFTSAGISAAGKLRYLLFAGYASTDYGLEAFPPDTVFKKGKKGFPALFPLLQVYQREYANNKYEQLLLPNDMMLGDANGSGVPDVAVGRFLATDAVELSNMVAKTVVHDLKHSWNQAVIVSDWDGVYGYSSYFKFSEYSTGLAACYSNNDWSVTHYPCATDTGFGKIWRDTYHETGLTYDFEKGGNLFYFIGHSSDTLMGHSSLSGKYILDNTRLSAADWSYVPLAMCMGCRMGRYTVLDVVNLRTCIMETALKNPDSGFSSVISTAGYISFGDAKELSSLISEEINLYGAQRIGDAWTAAMDQIGAADLARIQHTVLLGDPSMPICKPRYPTIIKIK